MTDVATKLLALDYFLMNEYAIKHGVIQRNKKDRDFQSFFNVQPNTGKTYPTLLREDVKFYAQVTRARIASSFVFTNDQATYDILRATRGLNFGLSSQEFLGVVAGPPRIDRNTSFLQCTFDQGNTRNYDYRATQNIRVAMASLIEYRKSIYKSALISFINSNRTNETLLPSADSIQTLDSQHCFHDPFLTGSYFPTWFRNEIIVLVYSTICDIPTNDQALDQVKTMMESHKQFWAFEKKETTEEVVEEKKELNDA